MDNILENNNAINLDQITIEFIDNDSSTFGFDIKNIEGFETSINDFDGYYLVGVWNYDLGEGKDFLFDKNRNLVTWKQRKNEVENRESEIFEIDGYKLERRRNVNLNEGQEFFDLKVSLNGEILEDREYSAMGKYDSMDDEYKDFLRRDKLKSEEEKSREKYKNSSLDEKLGYWTSLIWSYVREGDKFDISEIRNNKEENIDLFLNSLIDSIVDLIELDREKVIEKYFILDDIARSYIKKDHIEGIDISNEELAEKVGDLFYDSLSSFISSLGEKIDNKEISKLLEDASKNIMTAWEICLPYVSHDFPEMKHTTEIKGLDIDKEELAERISNLIDTQLKDFLGKLSVKINKDGKADEGRNRIKLSTELYACANKIKQASELLS